MTRDQALDLCIAASAPIVRLAEYKWSQSPVAFGDREDGTPVFSADEILPLTPGQAERIRALREMAELGHGL